MDNGIHFISGLPRSGSTLLASLLRQNPRFHASVTSPVGSLMTMLLRQMSMENETAVFLDDARRSAILHGVFGGYYAHEHPTKVIFDTNRSWTAKLPALARLFPQARIIACVRHVPWIIDSIELLVQRNALEPSQLFNFDPTLTVYSRHEQLSSANGLVGYAWNALRQAFFGPHADRLMLLSYETLVADPARALRAVYGFIGAAPFTHDFDNVSFDATALDARLGMKGLHVLRPRVAAEPRKTILPPDLFRRVERDSFWLEPDAAKLGVPIV